MGKNHVQPQTVYNYETVLKAGGRGNAGMVRAAGEFMAAKEERPFFLLVGFHEPHRAKVGFGNDAKVAAMKIQHCPPGTASEKPSANDAFPIAGGPLVQSDRVAPVELRHPPKT